MNVHKWNKYYQDMTILQMKQCMATLTAIVEDNVDYSIDEVMKYDTVTAKSGEVYELICNICCNVFEVERSHFDKGYKIGNLGDARTVAIYMYKEFRKVINTNIAREFKLNHASITYNLKKYNQLYGFDKAFTAKADYVESLINERVKDNEPISVN